MATEEASSSFLWSREQDKAFENALTIYTEDNSDRWEKIAKDVGGKTVEEIKRHFEILVEDIEAIESGAVPLPCYVSSSDGSGDGGDEGAGSKKGGNSGSSNGQSRHGKKSSRAEQERRKGIAWTEDEHKLFLQGLEKYGKGDWRSISRNFVVTRTPTQVASHAQKYFIRLNSINKDRRRSSIHDITSIDNGDLPSPQGPITGQTNVPVIPVKLNKQPIPHPAGHGGISVYGTPTIGQPIGGPLVSAVGTPVNISQPPHLAYPVRAPVPGTMVPGAPMAYPMQHASSHR